MGKVEGKTEADLDVVEFRADLDRADEQGLTIVGPEGENWTLAQLSAWFGAEVEVAQVVSNPKAGFYANVVRLEVRDGPCAQMVKVIDDAGKPLQGVRICRWWQDAPELPPFPEGCMATRFKDRAVHGPTNENGDIGFGMGGGDMPGSSGVWLVDCDCPGAWVGGLGWKPYTNHAAIAVTYQVFPAETEPPVPPPPEGDIEGLLKAIWSKLDQIYENLRTPRVIVEG